ncbi:hypothetical protein GUITHDRAFT_165285 [Guillardia theta CCMP2712]|uniref:Uncharacterized protein n=2 Tax=Guillardia theta TaxID=55529 RepID=L1IPZ2_GUITC|nr:hypothetical protein GUITHDRAFT_165285 [Guillardia theta CCMP2712]EKX38162.1 hypothetical protein GUITHDRAFT_165285 [Guillardia theta CCMP2712]|mmetsp:Transcript_33140/g.104816  ORF Transcript_33140/g.104816 Transcript_33140/m.104816 type:complete len:103 (+) Transcript_33140:285-593(+)|eukprot:XP_005825142.1 hypothetical protein GUITHDRAFT_165285 [Guillardia theta CCMP2712]
MSNRSMGILKLSLVAASFGIGGLVAVEHYSTHSTKMHKAHDHVELAKLKEDEGELVPKDIAYINSHLSPYVRAEAGQLRVRNSHNYYGLASGEYINADSAKH